MTRRQAERLIAQAKTLDELQAVGRRIEAEGNRNYHVWNKLRHKTQRLEVGS